jgi:hypothetical protein
MQDYQIFEPGGGRTFCYTHTDYREFQTFSIFLVVLFPSISGLPLLLFSVVLCMLLFNCLVSAVGVTVIRYDRIVLLSFSFVFGEEMVV